MICCHDERKLITKKQWVWPKWKCPKCDKVWTLDKYEKRLGRHMILQGKREFFNSMLTYNFRRIIKTLYEKGFINASRKT